jgi:hypothetical protein
MKVGKMANFLITKEGYGINLSLLEHFDILGTDIFLTVAGKPYTTSMNREITIEELGNLISKALNAPNSVVHWSKLSRQIS